MPPIIPRKSAKNTNAEYPSHFLGGVQSSLRMSELYRLKFHPHLTEDSAFSNIRRQNYLPGSESGNRSSENSKGITVQRDPDEVAPHVRDW